ncbi:hypothetical protein V5O48_016196 [Marasmius crinis-equi]|uniref:Uncharacterized protein n=1 Tax=Marasmius crinis-equi TaxID=585013 RepID=A0ABR3ESF2_9AGAR
MEALKDCVKASKPSSSEPKANGDAITGLDNQQQAPTEATGNTPVPGPLHSKRVIETAHIEQALKQVTASFSLEESKKLHTWHTAYAKAR